MRSTFQLRIADCGLRIRATSRPAIRNSSGFTLLQLAMVMTIIVPLAAVGVTSYQHIQSKARETALKQEMQTMRAVIVIRAALDRYANYANVVGTGDARVRFLRRLPIDPTSGTDDWGLRSYTDKPDSTW